MDNSFIFANAIRLCQICNLESESENEEVDDEEPAFTVRGPFQNDHNSYKEAESPVCKTGKQVPY